MTHLSQLTNGKVSTSDLGNGLVNLAGLVFTGVALAGIFNLFAPGPEGYHGVTFKTAPTSELVTPECQDGWHAPLTCEVAGN